MISNDSSFMIIYTVFFLSLHLNEPVYLLIHGVLRAF